MKKIKGFRLGRKMLCAWRWALSWRCRPRSRAYLRLPPATAFSSPSESPHHHHHQKPVATPVMAKIASWGRRLTRRLCPSSRICFSRGGGDGRVTRGENHCLLLDGGEHTSSHHLPSSELDEDCRRRRCHQPQQAAWSKPPPKGHMAVYVGRKDGGPPHRFLVPVIYVNHPLFAELLRQAQQEFGFHHPGGITIPCPISDFESVRTRVAAAAAGVNCRHPLSAESRRWRLP